MPSRVETLEHLEFLLRNKLVRVCCGCLDCLDEHEALLFLGNIPQGALVKRKASLDEGAEWYLLSEEMGFEEAEELRSGYGVLVVEVYNLDEALKRVGRALE